MIVYNRLIQKTKRKGLTMNETYTVDELITELHNLMYDNCINEDSLIYYYDDRNDEYLPITCLSFNAKNKNGRVLLEGI